MSIFGLSGRKARCKSGYHWNGKHCVKTMH
jgi:hypothetical protein